MMKWSFQYWPVCVLDIDIDIDSLFYLDTLGYGNGVSHSSDKQNIEDAPASSQVRQEKNKVKVHKNLCINFKFNYLRINSYYFTLSALKFYLQASRLNELEFTTKIQNKIIGGQ